MSAERSPAFLELQRKALLDGVGDIFQGLKNIGLAFFFAWGDTKARYRRSVLGPFWMVLSTAVSVAGLGFLWSMLLKDDPIKLVPSLTVGLVIWQFISGCILEAPTVFSRNAHFIRNIRIPFFIFPMQLVMRQLINFGHNAIVVVVVVLYFSPVVHLNQLLIIPGLLIVIGNLSWIILLIAMLGSRFRDFEQIIGAVMPLMFFLSPVIYRPSQLGIAQQIVWFNPFSYFITLIRDPILGNVPPLFVYQVSLLALLIGTVFTVYQFGKHRKHISFWI
ncbi:ABC transporter permease [Pseudomonas sp. K2I15]|uniref:ABC transporter permease n=1 Tax=unclassified Pseudomonas TaxID=196821 RepID=UPI000B4C9152|nr:ABC transporter permease [Pseudomonas sp. K2I15]OWP69554.1 ABC transporter permease [Pseudomonas sp. K2I15]